MQGTELKKLAAPAAILGLAALLWLALGHGFANYDSFYTLVWGDELFNGQSPDYDGALVPTPHPLATFAALLLAPLGDGAETAWVALSYLSLAAIAYLVYRLGELWLNRWVGLLAAAIVITRVPVLDFGVRGYVDLPYVALVLAALVVETKRERAGWPVLALLALAGLLRPEAWLFAGAYLLYLAYTHPDREPGRLGPLKLLYRPDGLLGLTALAAAAPLIWAGFDWAIAGDPLYSLTGTQDTVGDLERDTGLGAALELAPRRLGEILREPVLIGAIGGAGFSLWLLRDRKLLVGAAGIVLALGAFLLLATAGLAVITRYLLLPGVLLAIFAAAGVLGWLSVGDRRWRTWWTAFGAAIVAGILVLGPQQFNRLSDLRDRIADQEQIRDDLNEIADEGEIKDECAVAITDYQGVPLLAGRLERRPSEIEVATETEPSTGYLFVPADESVADLFALDQNAPHAVPDLETGGVAPLENRSWRIHGACDD